MFLTDTQLARFIPLNYAAPGRMIAITGAGVFKKRIKIQARHSTHLITGFFTTLTGQGGQPPPVFESTRLQIGHDTQIVGVAKSYRSMSNLY